jgi:hypothetical protein
MSSTRGIGFFLLVLYFAGSVVVVAAHDIRAALPKQGDSKRAEVKALVRQLRGDPLVRKGQPFLHADEAPAREKGRSLTKHDRSFLKRLLRGFISVGEDAVS